MPLWQQGGRAVIRVIAFYSRVKGTSTMSRRVIIAASLVLVSCVPVQASAPLAERLPAKVLVYLGWAGKTGALDASAFGKLVNDPVVAEILDSAKQAIISKMPTGSPQEMFSNAWSMAGIAWKHPCAIALISLEPDRKEGESRPARAQTVDREVPEPDKKKGEPQPKFALVIDLGKDREPFAQHLDAIILAAGKDIKLTDKTFQDVQYRQIDTPGGAPLAFGYIGDLFFACFGEGVDKQIIGMKESASLKADKQFTEALSAVSDKDDAQCVVYEDIKGLIDAVDKIAPKTATTQPAGEASEVRKVVAAMGLDKATVVAGTMRFVDGGVYSKMKLFSPAPHKGLLKLVSGKPLVNADLAGVPADADFACAGNISASDAFNELKRFINAAAPDEDVRLDERIADVEKRLGVSFEKDIFASLGDTWVISSAESQGGFLTGTLMTVEVKDAERLGAAIAKIEAFFKRQAAGAEQEEPEPTMTFWSCSMHPQVREYGPGQCPICNMELVQIETSIDSGRRRKRGKSFDICVMKSGKTEIHYVAASAWYFPMPVAPAWAIHEGKLYVALWPQVIVAAIENPPVDAAKAEADAAERGAETMLTQSGLFRQARSKLAANPTVLVYMNTQRIFKKVYPLLLAGWTMGANALQREENITDAHRWLPALPRMNKYLGVYMAAVSADDTGILYEEFGSFPFQGLTSGPISSPLFMLGFRSVQREEPERSRSGPSLPWWFLLIP